MNKQTGKNVDRILVEVTQNNWSVFAWKSVNGVVNKCELKIKAFRKEYNEIEFEVVNKENESISDVVTGLREVNFYVPESSVSFTAVFKKTIDEFKFKVTVPTMCEYFERRKHERVKSNNSFVIFEVNKMSYKKPMYDVSLGGFAFIIPRADKIVVKKGTVVEKCILEINNKKIPIKAECVAAVVIDRFKFDYLPYGGVKIAFRFTAISKEDKIFLAEYITTQSILNKRLKGA